MAGLGVIGAISTHRRNSFRANSSGSIADAAVSDFNGTDLQGFCIDTQMHLAPLATVFSAMLLGLPFLVAQHLHAGAVDQQMQADPKTEPPNHVPAKPDRQGGSGLEGSVVVFPVGGAVLSRNGFSHGA